MNRPSDIPSPVRRRRGDNDDLIYAIVAAGTRPLSAYDIVARARERTQRLMAPQVYRTLARLIRQRRVLRVEMLRAYMPYVEDADLCLVCLGCQQVQLVATSNVRSIAEDAGQCRFQLASRPVEAGGLCRSCTDRRTALF